MMGKRSKEKTYAQIFRMDMQNLRETQDTNSQETKEHVINAIILAPRIGFIGYRTSRAIAYLLYYYLSRVRKDCEFLNSGDNLSNQLIHFGPGDLLIALSFPRYARETIEILKYGKRMG